MSPHLTYALASRLQLARYGYRVVRPVLEGPVDIFLAVTGLGERVFVLSAPIDEGNAARDLFARSMRLLSLKDPNLVPILEAAICDGNVVVASQAVEASSLRDAHAAVMRRRLVLPFAASARVACDVLRGLAAAHAHGVLHGGISPDAVVVTADGVAMVKDFGVRDVQLGAPSVSMAHFPRTVSYLAPEQIEGEPTDERTDVYSVGVVLWELVAGRPLKLEADLPRTVERVLRARARLVSEVAQGVHPRLDAAIARALEPEPSRRWQTASEMADELARYVAVDCRAPGHLSSLAFSSWK